MLYPSNISDLNWDAISKILTDSGHRLNRRKWDLREIFDACLYVVDNGTKWRSLPNDFPPWKIVYHYYRRW